MDVKLPPYLTSEVSSRLLAVDPAIREAFNQEKIELPGEAFEQLSCALWLMGYGAALGDIADGGGRMPKLTPLAEWVSENLS